MSGLLTSLQLRLLNLQKSFEDTDPKASVALEDIQMQINQLKKEILAEEYAEQERAKENQRLADIQKEIEKLDLTKQDYNIKNTFEDILDSDGNIVGKKIVDWEVVPYDLTADEQKARAKKTEPEGATQKEIDEMDETTHKVVVCDCGMADGTIMQMPRIVAMTEQEIEARKISQAQEKHTELRDKIMSGDATADELEQFKALNSLLK